MINPQDGLHPRVLKEIQSYIVEPLKIIFDLSLKTGRLPDDWQSAVVSPIYKKVSKVILLITGP